MKVYLITDSTGFYGQRSYPWESIDVDIIIGTLKKDFELEQVTFDAIVNGEVDIEGALVLYTSSQQPEYKEYIEDVLIYLMQKGNALVPSINMFKSHENKGYQELHKKLVGIESIPSLYVGHHKEILKKPWQHPSVLKDLGGYGSDGVNLVQSMKDVSDLTTTDECLLRRGFLRRMLSKVAKPIRKHVFGKKYIDSVDYGDYYSHFKRFVLQKFLQDMTYDYKVLIINSKFYVLKRYAREGDFRASGSGNFSFEDVSDVLLDYAESVFFKFNEPFISLDICFDGTKHHLIEFQGMHFGPYTLTHSKGYYMKNGGRWIFNECFSELDVEVAESLLNYLKMNKFYPSASHQ